MSGQKKGVGDGSARGRVYFVCLSDCACPQRLVLKKGRALVGFDCQASGHGNLSSRDHEDRRQSSATIVKCPWFHPEAWDWGQLSNAGACPFHARMRPFLTAADNPLSARVSPTLASNEKVGQGKPTEGGTTRHLSDRCHYWPKAGTIS